MLTVASSLFLCDVIRSCYCLLTPLLQVSQESRRERKEVKDKKKYHGAVDEPSLE